VGPRLSEGNQAGVRRSINTELATLVACADTSFSKESAAFSGCDGMKTDILHADLAQCVWPEDDLLSLCRAVAGKFCQPKFLILLSKRIES
jgi:hypothetical protein